MSDALLDVRDLSVERGKRVVVSDVSCSVSRGEIVALIGPNGSGKSTLLRSLVGSLPHCAGTILLDGSPIVPDPRRMLDRGVAYMPQSGGIFRDLTIEENLRIVAPDDPRAREEAARQYGFLLARANERAGSLSGGEQQMLSLVCTFLLAPRLLLLDEPCGGLSATKGRALLQRLASWVREQNAAALVVEQRVHEVLQVADRVLILRNGTIGFAGRSSDVGDPAELMRRFLF